MKRNVLSLVLVCLTLVLITVGPAFGAEASSLPDERIRDATKVLMEISKQEDSGTMCDLLAKAEGVAIFPQVVKAGLMLGARYGKGIVLKRDYFTGQWYGPSFLEMTGLSYGFQIGVQSTALVLVITNERGMKSFEEGSFTFGGDVAIAAGPVGRHLEAGTDIQLKSAIYSYSMSKGAFVGLSLEGAKIKPDEAANELYWRHHAPSVELLQTEAAGSEIEPLIMELNELVLKGGGRILALN
ncbi:MAG: lipid-binding SYLF domain-containing protein [Firmicutes bacterium]|nr:lipid-binding SYLF domain-containing protein [Bacillota bacterium]